MVVVLLVIVVCNGSGGAGIHDAAGISYVIGNKVRFVISLTNVR